MPIYEMTLPGADKPRLIKAKDVSAALKAAGVVDIKAVGAERMIELQDQGVTLEKAPDPTDPASHAPGGALHKPAGATGGEEADAAKATGKGGKEG